MILRLHKDGHITTEEAKTLMEHTTPITKIVQVPTPTPEPVNPIIPYTPYPYEQPYTVPRDPLNPFGPIITSYSDNTTSTVDNLLNVQQNNESKHNETEVSANR